MSDRGPLPPLGAVQSRSDLLVEAVRDAILSGHFKPGQLLVERELAAAFGVSKTPVREALKVLARSGLVERDPYRGTSVRRVDRQMVTSVYEVRLLLEPEAVRRAAAEHSRETLAAAGRTLGRAREAGAEPDHVGLSRLNRRFHRELYAPCPNKLLTGMLDGLQEQVALIAVAGWRAQPTWQEEADDHAAILAAVQQGDADGAGRLLRRHVETFYGRMMASLGPDLGPDLGPETDTDPRPPETRRAAQ
ncbi:MAG: FCD domain-containing protein [Streptosporangiales bacterium]|nr:FCD domain-containing protein [Streptosporangiales bacterium]